MNLMATTDIRKWLFLKIAERGWDQKDAAKESGLSGTLISKILKGEKPVTCRSAILLARAFEDDVIYVLYIAGHLTDEEYGIEKRWITDMPELKEICGMLVPLNREDRERMKKIMIASLGFKGGDSQEAQDEEAGHG